MAKRKPSTLPATDLVLQALHGIRAEVKGLRGDVAELRAEIQKTNARIDETNARLDETNARLDRLDRRVTEGFLETNTKIAELSGRVVQLGDRLENVILGQMGQDVRDLKARMHVVEDKLASAAAHERPPDYGEKR
jgi:chromosome segregation ATPase